MPSPVSIGPARLTVDVHFTKLTGTEFVGFGKTPAMGGRFETEFDRDELISLVRELRR